MEILTVLGWQENVEYAGGLHSGYMYLAQTWNKSHDPKTPTPETFLKAMSKNAEPADLQHSAGETAEAKSASAYLATF